jgi:hypothetical protein
MDEIWEDIKDGKWYILALCIITATLIIVFHWWSIPIIIITLIILNLGNG